MIAIRLSGKFATGRRRLNLPFGLDRSTLQVVQFIAPVGRPRKGGKRLGWPRPVACGARDGRTGQLGHKGNRDCWKRSTKSTLRNDDGDRDGREERTQNRQQKPEPLLEEGPHLLLETRVADGCASELVVSSQASRSSQPLEIASTRALRSPSIPERSVTRRRLSATSSGRRSS